MLEVSITKKLNNFTLDIDLTMQNDALAILGASGAGKSMLLKCIAGVETPDSGKITVDGETLFDSDKKINLPPQKRKIGLLFQNYALFPTMTVIQNIMCGCHHLSKKEKKQKAMEYIESFGLLGLENVYPAQLSGGEQQRTALARMLASEPKLLLLDEPFSALDLHLRRQFRDITHKIIQNHNGTALLITHDAKEAFELCPYIAAIKKGRIMIKKPSFELFKNPEITECARLIGCENIFSVENKGNYIPALDIYISNDKNIDAIGIHSAHIYISDKYKYKFTATCEQVIPSPDKYYVICTTNGGEKLIFTADSFKNKPNDILTLSFSDDDIIYLNDKKQPY